MMFEPTLDTTVLEMFLIACAPHLEEVFARLYGYNEAQMTRICRGFTVLHRSQGSVQNDFANFEALEHVETTRRTGG